MEWGSPSWDNCKHHGRTQVSKSCGIDGGEANRSGTHVHDAFAKPKLSHCSALEKVKLARANSIEARRKILRLLLRHLRDGRQRLGLADGTVPDCPHFTLVPRHLQMLVDKYPAVWALWKTISAIRRRLQVLAGGRDTVVAKQPDT